MNPHDPSGAGQLPVPADDALQPQRWLLLDDAEGAAGALADAVAQAGSALARLRLAHGLVAVTGLPALARQAATALGGGLHALRIHGSVAADDVRAALRPVLDAQQAHRTQYVHAAQASLPALVAELCRPDAAVFIGWWQSRGAVVPRLDWPGAEEGVADAAVRAFKAWAADSGAEDELAALMAAEAAEGEDTPDAGRWLQPADLDDVEPDGDDDPDGADGLRPRQRGPLPGGPAIELPPHPLRRRLVTPLAASGAGGEPVLRWRSSAGNGRGTEASADRVDVFETPVAGRSDGVADVRFRVHLNLERWAGRDGLRLEVHLPHRLPILVPLDGSLGDQDVSRRLARESLPPDREGWAKARCRVDALPRVVQR